MTNAEIILWSRIKNKQLGYKFLRQQSIGSYIVDFYCPTARLVIEIDGGQHYEGAGKEADRQRDKYLGQKLKLKVLRFTNIDVLKNIEGVIMAIIEKTKNPL